MAPNTMNRMFSAVTTPCTVAAATTIQSVPQASSAISAVTA
jgi:hypothetical protein